MRGFGVQYFWVMMIIVMRGSFMERFCVAFMRWRSSPLHLLLGWSCRRS